VYKIEINIYQNIIIITMTSKIIPSFPRYTINENTEVYDTKNERIVGECNDKYGYKVINLYGDDNIRKTRLIHRLMYEAFGLAEGEIMPNGIDHIDNDKTNNLITNLRSASSQENSRNRKKPITNTSGYKNIYILPSGSYKVQIWITTDVRYYKCHKTLELAIADAIRVRELHHGHFVNHG
jgi:hypothetical protein